MNGFGKYFSFRRYTSGQVSTGVYWTGFSGLLEVFYGVRGAQGIPGEGAWLVWVA
jgi:hypothetical protein